MSAIIMKNLARVELPEQYKKEILELYVHTSRDGQVIRNYKYKDGVAYLPLNQRKLNYVASILNVEIIDAREDGEPLLAPFSKNPVFSFRDHQIKPAAELVGYCLQNNYAVLNAPCSCGKTVVMTYAAGMLGQKVLILVDMGSLQSQWAEAFELVWGKKVQILNRDSTVFADVCVSTFQLLHSNPGLVNAVRKHFGTLLLDEFHTTASETRREILFKLCNKYRIGCTATLMKKGFNHDVLTDTVADTSVSMTDPKALTAEVHLVDSGVGFKSNNPDDWGKTISYLGKDPKRNQNLAALVGELAQQNRKILLIGVTVDSLKDIERLLIKNCPDCKLRVYVGATSHKQDQALRADLASGVINVIATVKKADKGLDLPSLDCLVFAKPTNNEAAVTQIAGRIVRPVDGKPTPVIYDVVDRGVLSSRFLANRLRWYKKLGYSIIKTIDN